VVSITIILPKKAGHQTYSKAVFCVPGCIQSVCPAKKGTPTVFMNVMSLTTGLSAYQFTASILTSLLQCSFHVKSQYQL
jgi:hypothetical protein